MRRRPAARRRDAGLLLTCLAACARVSMGSNCAAPGQLPSLEASAIARWGTECHRGQLCPSVAAGAEAVVASTGDADHSVVMLQGNLRLVQDGVHGSRASGADEAPERPSGAASLPRHLQLGQPRFLHIPRTGGTSIEMANMLLPPGYEAFASLFHDSMTCLQASMYPDKTLAEIYNITNDGLRPLPYLVSEYKEACFHFMSIGGGHSSGSCFEFHYPPMHSTLVRTYHQQGPTFCAVREPSKRFLSAFKVSLDHDLECSGAAYDQAIASYITGLAVIPYDLGCFFLPQGEFTHGDRLTLGATPYCQHIIHTENLEEEFNALMLSLGRSVKLPPQKFGDSWTEGCDVQLSDLSFSTRHLLYEYYKTDYDLFGYTRPF